MTPATAQAKRSIKSLLRKSGILHPLLDLRRSMSPASRAHYENQRHFHRSFIRADSLCFDIGAHYGLKCQMFVDLGARVVAVEPTPACLEGLRWRHGNNPAVTIVPRAISDEIGTATIYSGDSLAVSSLRRDWYPADKSKVGIEVPTTTLDRLIAEHGCPDFCKIDVEGCELQVFRGLSQPLPMIGFEFVQPELELTRACLDHLAGLGKISCNVSAMESMHFRYDDWCGPEELIDRLGRESDLRDGDVFVMSLA